MTNVYNLTVNTHDEDEKTNSIDLTVSVTDVLNDLPDVEIGSDSNFSIPENTREVATYYVGSDSNFSIPENARRVASRYRVSDSAQETYSWSLRGDDKDHFEINDQGNKGTVKFKSLPDYETPKSTTSSNTYSLIVVVKNRAGLEIKSDLTVDVVGVSEAAPVLENVGDISTVSIAETTTAVASYKVTDADAGDTVRWFLTGDDEGLFDINSSGELIFRSAPDYETPGSGENSNTYSLTVTAADAGGLEDSTQLTLEVTDVNEAPLLNFNDESTTVVENHKIVGIFGAYDEDKNDNLTYSITGNDSYLFDINSKLEN